MNQTRTARASRPATSHAASGTAVRIGRTVGALLKGLAGLLEDLVPQPQLQPIPVRVRRGPRSSSARG